jgi:hypothetical protein
LKTKDRLLAVKKTKNQKKKKKRGGGKKLVTGRVGDESGVLRNFSGNPGKKLLTHCALIFGQCKLRPLVFLSTPESVKSRALPGPSTTCKLLLHNPKARTRMGLGLGLSPQA